VATNSEGELHPTDSGAGAPRRSDGAELIQRSAQGDREAFSELYERFAGPVFGTARRVLRDPAQAEEVTQEVLVEIWRTASRYDAAKGSAAAWIMTLAHRRAVDRVRSEQASRDRDKRVGRSEQQRPFDEVAETVETRDEHAQVRRAVRQLSDLQRESLELAYYGGHTYREVAELLDTPLGTVKTRLRDALTNLRDALGRGP
jgi:RNA polymerase sigma-70 factor (ECF subfamily)